MTFSSLNYGRNLLALVRGEQLLRPLAMTYYVTTRCNLNCSYCEDFGARRNGQASQVLNLADAQHVLRVIRTATDRLILTGGEPLLYPDIDELVAYAHRKLGFRLTLLTNAALLHEHVSLLPHLDRLVISLDSPDPALWSGIINVPLAMAESILSNIRNFAAEQRQYDCRIILNCVVTAQTLVEARAVFAFCRDYHLLFSLSPQAVQNWPSYDLLVSADYRVFIEELITAKKNGEPVLASLAYLRTLLDFQPYACYPTLVPRVMPGGELVYPCRPIEKDGRGHGGRPCSLLDVENWQQAVGQAVIEYGSPPLVCTSCFQQCFAEPSLMQARPLAWLSEWLCFPASRAAGLPSFAPG